MEISLAYIEVLKITLVWVVVVINYGKVDMRSAEEIWWTTRCQWRIIHTPWASPAWVRYHFSRVSSAPMATSRIANILRLYVFARMYNLLRGTNK